MGSVVFGVVLFLQNFLLIPFETSLVERLKCKDLGCFLSPDVMDVFAISFSRLLMLCFPLLLPESMSELDIFIFFFKGKIAAQAAKKHIS